MKANAKIGFVLLSNSKDPIPSTRIAALNMFPLLVKLGFDPHILFEPETATEMPELKDLEDRLTSEAFQVVIFQKVYGRSVENMVKRLTQRGIKSIYLVCDIINETMVELTDKTVVVTEFLKNQYPVDLHSKIHVIHDGIEHSQDQKDYYRADTGSRFHPLNAALITSANLERLPQIGSPPPWLHVAIVGRYPKQREIMKRLQQIKWACMAKKRNKSELFSYIQFLCETRISRFAWSEETAYRCMRNADIGILPINAESDPIHNLLAPSWKLKSENRLTMKMAMGLPVIATPIPAYENVIKHGENGFLARSASDWQACLSMLRDPARRQQVGNAARKSVIETFSMESQSVMLASVIESLLMSKQNTTSFDHAN